MSMRVVLAFLLAFTVAGCATTKLPPTPENAADSLPNDSLESDAFAQIKEEFQISTAHVHIPYAGAGEWLAIPLTSFADVFLGLWPGADLRLLKPSGGNVRPLFIPVHIAGENEMLSGIPEIDLYLVSTASKLSTRVFVGVGVQRAGKMRVRVAGKQLTPLSKKGHFNQELPALSTPLKAGDRVGLVVYGYSLKNFRQSSWLWKMAKVSGSIKLPIIEQPLDKTH